MNPESTASRLQAVRIQSTASRERVVPMAESSHCACRCCSSMNWPCAGPSSSDSVASANVARKARSISVVPLIWRNAEGARDAREPVGKNLCRLARGFQFEQDGVDPGLEPRLVLLDAEACRAWQFII